MTSKEGTGTIQKELKELEEIANWFENNSDLDVETGLEKVRRGAELAKSLKGKLKSVENEFREIEAELSDDE
jgi:exonuclease VII small subunit